MGSSRVIPVWLLSFIAILQGGGVTAAEVVDDAGKIASLSKATDHVAGADRAETLHDAYHLQPGDVLEISVWKETDLQREVLIRPDGCFTFPLAGEVEARDKSVEAVR